MTQQNRLRVAQRPKNASKGSGQQVVPFSRFRWCTVQQVMDWCCVSRASAYQFIRGNRVPGPQSAKLFYLHRDGRVLGDDWAGFSVQGGKLVTPNGYAFSPTELQMFGLLYQHAKEVCKAHGDTRLAAMLAAYNQL